MKAGDGNEEEKDGNGVKKKIIKMGSKMAQ